MPAQAEPLERLVVELSKLPGIGRKTASRLAFHLIKTSRDEVEALARALVDLKERLGSCSTCFNLSERDRCPICEDPRRDGSMVCVVEEASDVASVERTGSFRGVYHVLGGALSPLRDIGPDDLHAKELVDRVRSGTVREVILALSPDVEGEATAAYLARLLKPLEVAVTRIATGLPAGAELEFTDDLTLRRALEGRRDY